MSGNPDYDGDGWDYPDEEDEPERDYWQEYKDDLAMGYINRDGTQREPDEPDWAAEEYARHCDEAHGGRACDCPPPDPDPWALPAGETYDTEAPSRRTRWPKPTTRTT